MTHTHLLLLCDLGDVLDTIHTGYDVTNDYFCNSGFTFKKKMIENFTKYHDLSICFRIKMDFFPILIDYTSILELLAGGIGDGCNSKNTCNVTHRTMDLRIGYAMNIHNIIIYK